MQPGVTSPMSTPNQMLHRDRDKLIPTPIPLNVAQSIPYYSSNRPMTPPTSSPVIPPSPTTPHSPSQKHGYPSKVGYSKYGNDSPTTHKHGLSGKYPPAKVPKHRASSPPHNYGGSGMGGSGKPGKSSQSGMYLGNQFYFAII